MKVKYTIIFYLFIVYLLLFSCISATTPPKTLAESGNSGMNDDYMNPDRMLVWTATLKMEVDNVEKAVEQVTKFVNKNKGYIENNSIEGEKSADMIIRIPVNKMYSILDAISTIGDEKYRYVSSEDVTENYIDTEARLKNAIALRKRLKELIVKAKDVKDILTIEKELARVQSEIDSMEGRLKKLKGEIDYATINLSIERKTILGPLGYIAKGIGWILTKLFVIR